MSSTTAFVKVNQNECRTSLLLFLNNLTLDPGTEGRLKN